MGIGVGVRNDDFQNRRGILYDLQRSGNANLIVRAGAHT